MEFNYDQIQWQAGEFSGGDSACQGGSPARIGYSNGSDGIFPNPPPVAFELPGSAVNGAFLDSNTSGVTGYTGTGLIYNSINSTQLGRYVFFAREGEVETPPEPEPPSDTTPPNITATVTGTLGNNGWYVSDVTVTWTVSDPDSAVTSTSGCDPSGVTSDTAGRTYTCTATSAGGTASASVTIKRDATDPVISSSRSATPNGNDWYNGSVTVSYLASDALSGIDAGPSDLGDDVLSEGAGQSATGTAVDLAGNSASATESPINIDLTDPIISSSRSATPNGNDWYNGSVTVSYLASDALSGIDAGPSDLGDDVLSEGAGQSATGTAVDLAGNSASATESPINIDLTDPIISSSRSATPNGNDWYNGSVTVSYLASDALSGIDAGPSDLGTTCSRRAQARALPARS